MDTNVPQSKSCMDDKLSTKKEKKKCMFCKKLLTFFFSHLGLYLVVITYSVIGAFVFNILESKLDKVNVDHVIKIRNETIERLWQITETFNILREENWTAMASAEIINFQSQLLQIYKQGFDESQPTDQWSFSAAFLYSLTLITSLGSGINGPQTIEGKMATLIYAGIGIPLMLLFLASIGNLLANNFRCFYQNCCLCSSKTSANNQTSSSQHHIYDHYHVQLLKLNDINPNSEQVNLPCNSVKNNPLHVNTFFTPNHDCISLTANQTDGPFFVNHHNSTNETLEGINNCSQIGLKMCRNVDHNNSFPSLILGEAHPNYTTDGGETILPNTDHSHPHPQSHHHHHHHHIHPEVGAQLSNRTSILNEINHIEAGPLYEYTKNSPKYKSAKVNVPLVWCLVLIVGYLLLGAAVVYMWEGWSFCDGLYFCFLSLSTIGLGPANEMLMPFQSSIQKLALYSLYILGGLSLIAMCFNLTQDIIVVKFHLWSKKLGIWTEDEPTEEAVIVTQSPTINPVINEQDFVI